MTDEEYGSMVASWNEELSALIAAYRSKGMEPNDLIGALEAASSSLIDEVAGL